ncbi:MAG: Ig-like domain-containing protein [Candidatus Delongbacteria bacterium]
MNCFGVRLASLSLALSAAFAADVPGVSSGEPVPANRDLNQFVTTEVGLITLSADGLGMMGSSGLLQVEKPSAGATVRVAYLAAASTGFTGYVIPNGDILLAGTPVTWTSSAPNGIASYNHLANVTAIVAPLLGAAGPGITDVPVTELHSASVDGTALYVIFDDPATTSTHTAVLAFGAQATTGDNFSIGFGQPVFPDANTAVEFGLAISYGYARGTCQTSYVDVNGVRLTSSAGGNDEGENQNGALISVGGVGDSRTNPALPLFNDPCSYTDYTNYDDELYDIAGFIGAGNTSMSVHTYNPSADDNLFAAHLLLDFAAVVGEGAVLTPSTSAGCVGDPHSVTLTLQDSNGNPLANYSTSIEVLSGPNAGTTASGLSNALGQFSASWTSLTAGSDVIRGSFLNNSGVLQVSNLATQVWQDCQAAESGVLSPATATLCQGLPHTVTLTLQDAGGNPLVNYPAGILILSGPNVGQTASGFSNAAGQFSLTYTSTLTGVDQLRGSFTNSSGLLEYTNLAQVEWQQCTVTEIATLSPATATTCLGDPYTVTLTMEDDNGNLLPNYAVTLEVVSGPHAGLTASGNTDANGEFPLTFTSSVPGVDTVLGSFINSSGTLDNSNSAVNTWQGCNTGGWGEVTPVFSSGCLGDEFTATVTLRGGNGFPIVNEPVLLEVFEGPNTGVAANGTTDENGQFFLTYTSSQVGNDKLRGLFLDEFDEERQTNEAEREWLDCSIGSPLLVIENPSACNLLLTWDPVPGATAYQLWSSTGLGQPWILETTTGNPFHALGCIDGLPTKLYRLVAVAN